MAAKPWIDQQEDSTTATDGPAPCCWECRIDRCM
jgi:hypothetical protein